MTAGLRLLTVQDPVQQVALPVAGHPASAPEGPVRLGPYSLSAARDVGVLGDQLPLVVISHGNTGSPGRTAGLPRAWPVPAASSPCLSISATAIATPA